MSVGMQTFRRIKVKDVGEVAIVTFVDKQFLERDLIRRVGEEMFSLVEEHGCTKVILDFCKVTYVDSIMLGKLITMDKKVKIAKGKLRLCNMRPDIYEVFAITRLNLLFDMRDTREDTLEGF